MNIKKYLEYAKGIILYLILSFSLSLFLASLNLTKIPIFKNFWLLNILNLITPLITCIVLIIVYKDVFINKKQDLKANWQKYLNLMVKYYLVGLLLMIMTNLLISSITGNIAINEEQNRTLLNSLPLYSIIASIFLAPITEEIVFRASIKDLSNNINLKCFISCLLFGLMHVIFNGDFIFAIPYAALGFFLAKTYYETDNIFTSIIIHSMHNSICLLIILLGGLM